MLVFVDVDGVLNPTNFLPGYSKHEFAVPGGTFQVFLNPEHGKWLEELIFDTTATLAWCTYWEDNAQKFIAPVLDLPYMPVAKINAPYGYYDVAEIKAKSAVTFAGDEDFVFFDDEYYIGHQLNLMKSKGTHIWVDPEFGLRREHIVKARELIQSRSVQ